MILVIHMENGASRQDAIAENGKIVAEIRFLR
jgi:hypothetical protein